MQIEQSATKNYTAGRNGKKVIAIVNHITAGLMPGALSWMQNPAAKASAHYLVTKTGIIYQLVADQDTAWHAGSVSKPNWSLYDGSNPNRYTIGIEHECMSGGELTEAQYQATFWLHRQLIAKYKLPIDTDHIIGHYRIDSVDRPNCPGKAFPWDRLFSDLKGGFTVADKTPCTINIKETEFPGYLEGGSSYFAEGVKVKDVITALSNSITWDAKAMTATIK